MRKLNNTLLFAAILFFATSCLSESRFVPAEPTVVLSGDTELTLRIRIPDGYQGQGTRSLTVTQENTIEDVFVFVFSSANQLVYVGEGRDIRENAPLPVPSDEISGVGLFTVTLPIGSDTDLFRIMVLANVGTILTSNQKRAAGFSNKSYNAVIAEINSAVTGSMFQGTNKAIPMWGEEVESAPITEESYERETIRLHRAIARIDVGVGTHTQNGHKHSWSGSNEEGVIPFELQYVYVMRPNNRFAIIPAVANRQTPIMTRVLQPTIPSETTAFPVTNPFRFTPNVLTNGNAITQSIYVPEADTRKGTAGRPGDNNHRNRMALVIGGSFNNGPTTYYRVDFISGGNLVNVLRNHLYLINIRSVTGHGEQTPQDAYEAVSANMKAEIHDWVQSSEQIFLDGISWIRLHHTRNESLSRHAILYRTANTTDELHFESTISPDEWDLDADGFGLNPDGRVVPNDLPNFNVEDHTLIKTVENNRFRVELIKNNTPKVAEGVTIYTGFFKFTSLVAHTPNANDNPSELSVVANGRIRFPITITQRSDSPNDWIGGGATDVEFGEGSEEESI